MKHFYQDIPGMMDYEDLYSEMVSKFPNGSHFVEVGVWQGRSAAYMAVEINNSKKLIRFDVIDNFKKSSLASVELTLRDFGYVFVIKSDSAEAANLYTDNSIDFVFIDADHSEAGISRDIKAWLPKVKKGGVLAGHDYDNKRYPALKAAVDILLDVRKVSKMCWYYEKTS